MLMYPKLFLAATPLVTSNYVLTSPEYRVLFSTDEVSHSVFRVLIVLYIHRENKQTDDKFVVVI